MNTEAVASGPTVGVITPTSIPVLDKCWECPRRDARVLQRELREKLILRLCKEVFFRGLKSKVETLEEAEHLLSLWDEYC